MERDAPKYREYVAVSTDVFDEQNQLIGKLVTIYAHVDLDLDLDEANSLFVDGISVQAGELISAHLYSGTVGGGHICTSRSDTTAQEIRVTRISTAVMAQAGHRISVNHLQDPGRWILGS